MNQRIISVLLTTLGEDRDVLRFRIDDDTSLDIDLDSATCQSEIKKLFSVILQYALNEDIKLEFITEKDFPRELYKDVCTEYIKDIERELKNSTELIRN